MAYDKSGNIEARSLLELLAINPNFAAALGVLAVTHVINYVNGWGDLPEGCLKTGLEIAERAIACALSKRVAVDPNAAIRHSAPKPLTNLPRTAMAAMCVQAIWTASALASAPAPSTA